MENIQRFLLASHVCTFYHLFNFTNLIHVTDLTRFCCDDSTRNLRLTPIKVLQPVSCEIASCFYLTSHPESAEPLRVCSRYLSVVFRMHQYTIDVVPYNFVNVFDSGTTAETTSWLNTYKKSFHGGIFFSFYFYALYFVLECRLVHD